MRTHLVIGDAHAKDGVSNERFLWLGKLIVERKPDVIINMGDWADMPSLCKYEYGKASHEGLTYKKDIAAANDALRLMNYPIRRYNDGRRAIKEKQYNPRLISLLGNHEDRISKIGNEDSKFQGSFSTDDIKFKEYGWEVIPFLQPIEVDGILYCHYFQSGAMGKPLGGRGIARKMIAQNFQSSTVGHGHYLHYDTETKKSGKRFHALEAGCYFEHHENYAGMSNSSWWRGIILKHNVVEGDYDLELIRMDSIKQRYA